jgi:hypothetical protein
VSFLFTSRFLMPVLGVAVMILGTVIAEGWVKDPALTKSDYVGTIDVAEADARLYRDVAFEWRVASPAGSFKGSDTARIRIDTSGESTVVCGWVRMDKAGASIRATRWLSEARLKIGDIKVAALFIAPTDKTPADGLNAGCARIEAKPLADAALSLEGPLVREE